MIGWLTKEEIEDVLHNNALGRIGYSEGGRHYIVPMNYVYDGRDIICHSLPGTKINAMRKNPSVCFEVEEVQHFTNWKTVIGWGEYQELTEERARYTAMKLFVERTLRLKISETAVLPELAEKRVHPRSPGVIRPVVYRIVLLDKKGRFEHE